MTPLNATLQIDASAAWIWALITNFAGYADWNRLVPTIRGEPKLNARLRVRLAPAGRRPIGLTARVLVAARNRELRWSARTRLPGLLRLEHGFRIEQRAGGCRLHHALSCSGWLAGEGLLAALHEGFAAMNAALPALAHAAAVAPIVNRPTTPPSPRPDGRPRALTLKVG